jgi:hypothetical protein
MDGRKRLMWLALATFMIAPGKARARPRAYAAAGPLPPPQKQSRRRVERGRLAQSLPPQASPCGRHVVRVSAGAVFVDGRRVHPSDGSVYVLTPPAWRRDGRALAWLERRDGETRLVVLPDVGRGADPLPWTLPAPAGRDQVFWTGPNRVVVGPDVLAPRAVASWSER